MKTKIFYKLKNDPLTTYSKEFVCNTDFEAIELWKEELSSKSGKLMKKYKYDTFQDFFNQFINIVMIVSDNSEKKEK